MYHFLFLACAGSTAFRTAGNNAPPRLSDWMGDLLPLIFNKTLLDISVIQTHNSLSSELTATISDNCEGLTEKESAIAHDATILPKALNPEGVFAQKWAVVQSMDIIEQLNNGVRAIDFRMIWTAPADKLSSAAHDWYANHRVQSVETALSYLTRIRDWMLTHPNEILQIEISRHAGDSYPFTPISALTKFFEDVKQIYGSLLLNHTANPVKSTTIGQMIEAKQRVLLKLADYINMTSGGSDLASDQSHPPTRECTNIPDFNGITANIQDALKNCCINGSSRQTDTITKVTIGIDPSNQVYEDAAEVFFSPLKSELIEKCARDIGFSALSGKWCPGGIQDYNHLQSYYAQFFLEAVTNQSLILPNIVWVNDFGSNGRIQVGDGKGYAIMDVLLLSNVRMACKNPNDQSEVCTKLEQALLQRKSLHSLQTWVDPDQGRQLLPPN